MFVYYLVFILVEGRKNFIDKLLLVYDYNIFETKKNSHEYINVENFFEHER